MKTRSKTRSKKLDALFDEKPSAEFRDRVMQGAARELAKNEYRHQQEQQKTETPFWSRRFFALSGSAAALALLLPGLWFLRRSLRRSMKPELSAEDMAIAMMDPELLENSEILQNLEMLEDFEILQKWDGRA